MDDRDCGKATDCEEGADQEDLMDSDESPSGEPTKENGDWRTTLQPDSRGRIVNKILDILKRHLPFCGKEGLNELRKIAVRFEEKIFTTASSQSDYLRRISLKMLTMETKSQSTMPNTGNGSKPPDPGSQGMLNQVHSQGQTIPVTSESNQSQARQQLLLQSVPNNMISAGVQSSAGLQSGMPFVSGLSQDPISNVGQNSNMQNMSGISQNSTGLGMPSNIFANQQRQMQGRQQVLPQQQPQLYHHQLQQQLMKQNIQQGNLQPSLAQFHMQQQQQQNPLPPMQLQSSQQFGMQTSSLMQPSAMQSTPLPGLQQNQQSSLEQTTQSMLQQHQQSILKQKHQPQQTTSYGIDQQQIPMTQQSIISQMQSLSTQLQQQLGLQQQPNQVQQSMQQRLEASQSGQIGSNLVPAKGNAPGALQQYPVSTSQQPNISSLPSQSGFNVPKQNMNPQLVPFPQTIQMNTQLPSMLPFALTPQTIQMHQCQMMQTQRQQQLLLRHIQQQQMLLQQHLNQLAEQRSPAKIKTDELPHSHQMDIDAGNGMSTMSIPPLLPESKEANALTTDLGRPNIIEQPHDPMVNMAKGKPMSPELNATVVNMVDEAAIAVGEDLAAMRKRGLTGAERMRCYLSALSIILALIYLFFSFSS